MKTPYIKLKQTLQAKVLFMHKQKALESMIQFYATQQKIVDMKKTVWINWVYDLIYFFTIKNHTDS